MWVLPAGELVGVPKETDAYLRHNQNLVISQQSNTTVQYLSILMDTIKQISLHVTFECYWPEIITTEQ